MPRLNRAIALYALGLVLVTALAYWPGLSGEFLFDDLPNIVREPAVHAKTLSRDAMAAAAMAYPGEIGRPLSSMSFAVNHALGGLDPRGYKQANLLLHAINALLVFALVRLLMPLSSAKARWGAGAAFVVALVWAIHPLQVSTVLYVVQRMEMLSLAFVLLALVSYLHGRLRQQRGLTGWPWLLACVPLVGLGLLSKESALLFPAYTLALELTVLGFRAGNAGASRAWRYAYLAATIAAALVFLLFVVPSFGTTANYAVRDFDAYQRVLTQLRVLPMYLGWIVAPQPANYLFYYDNFPASQGLFQPVTTFLGALLLSCLAAAAVALRRRMPLLALGILLFFSSHLLTSNVIRLELVFEHRNYFAILGILLALADLVQRLPSEGSPAMRQLGVGLLVMGLLTLTLIRSATWGDGINLAMELAAKNPGSSRASMDLGELLVRLAKDDSRSRFYRMGMDEFERGAALPDSSPMPEQGLIVYSVTAGETDRTEWWDSIIAKLRRRAIGPQEMGMMVDFLRMRQEGVAFNDRKFADAYLVVVERVDLPATQLYAFGEHALKFLSDHTLALDLFELAVDKSSDDPEFIAAVIETLERDGHHDLAVALADYARRAGHADILLPAAGREPASAPGAAG